MTLTRERGRDPEGLNHLVCSWRPDPSYGDPPACWVATATHRRRLEHACAVLRWYGIAAHPGLGRDPDETRIQLRTDILERFPGAVGAYLFWTTADDQRCFTATGELQFPLTLHIAGKGIRKATAAAMRSVGITADTGTVPDTVVVSSHR